MSVKKEAEASCSMPQSSIPDGGIDESVPKESTPKAEDDMIRLRVIANDTRNEMHFNVKQTTSLLRLKRSYCTRMGYEENSCRFVFDGHRITDGDTPKSLDMINDDIIELYQEASGGM